MSQVGTGGLSISLFSLFLSLSLSPPPFPRHARIACFSDNTVTLPMNGGLLNRFVGGHHSFNSSIPMAPLGERHTFLSLPSPHQLCFFHSSLFFPILNLSPPLSLSLYLFPFESLSLPIPQQKPCHIFTSMVRRVNSFIYSVNHQQYLGK